jgi:uncharacterized membrane protein
LDLGQPERIASIVAGGLLLLFGLRNRSPVRLLLGLIGVGLIFQGAAGRNVVESVRTGQPLLAEPNGLRVKKSVTVNRPQAELYEYWRNLDNLPRFMPHVRSVQRHGAGRSHWVLSGPRGTVLKFDAQITVERPNQMIGWQTLPGAVMHHRGYVKFLPAPGNRGTEVHVALEYEPPGGAAGKLLGSLLGPVTEQQIQDEIRNFKRIMEAGDTPTTKGQPTGHSANGQEQAHAPEAGHP